MTGVRMPPELSALLDAWISRQPDPQPTRSEAIRIALTDWLSGQAQRTPIVRQPNAGAGSHAHALQHAEVAADRHLAEVDAHPEEKARRKRVVTKLAEDLSAGKKRK